MASFTRPGLFRWVVSIFLAATCAAPGRAADHQQLDDACMFAQSELIDPNTSPEAEAAFQLARAHDLSIVIEKPETIPLALRDVEPDRIEARRLYTAAAEMGHVGAMNNLAVYEQNGWGHPDPDSFPRNHPAAFRWNVEMARRGDIRGFVGMGLYYHSGQAGSPDPMKAQACFIQAAMAGDARGQLLLGQHDLNLLEALISVPPQSDRIPRGLALLEDLGQRGDHRGYEELALYFTYKDPAPLKKEFYLRETAKLSPQFFPSSLAVIYKFEDEPLYDPDMVACLEELTMADMPNVDKLCPRPDGPLRREDAGLSPAPDEDFDLSTLKVIPVRP